MPGYSRNHEANLREAKRLLTEAGYPNGFKTVLTNRNVKLPYIDWRFTSSRRGRRSAWRLSIRWRRAPPGVNHG